MERYATPEALVRLGSASLKDRVALINREAALDVPDRLTYGML